MKNIAIIFGGDSDEKDVSVNTGLSVIEAIKNDYNISPINITNVSFEDISNLNSNNNKYSELFDKLFNVDVVFIALHGGYGEDGRIQKYFEKHNINYTGSKSKASSIAIDKNRTKIIAKKINIPIIKWIILNSEKYNEKDSNEMINNLSFPLIIKPNNGGSTIGLFYVKDLSEFRTKILEAFKYSAEVMVEEYINGIEISIPIINSVAFPIIEINPSGFLYDYKSKYSKNGSEYSIPAKIKDDLARKITNNAISLYNKIGCRHYARIDFLVKDNKHYLLEVNTLPGLTSTSLLPKSAKYAGLSYKNLIKKIIKSAY
jgi:D-alanine-D-alanine ligase